MSRSRLLVLAALVVLVALFFALGGATGRAANEAPAELQHYKMN